jgi:hypothetical protein
MALAAKRHGICAQHSLAKWRGSCQHGGHQPAWQWQPLAASGISCQLVIG